MNLAWLVPVELLHPLPLSTTKQPLVRDIPSWAWVGHTAWMLWPLYTEEPLSGGGSASPGMAGSPALEVSMGRGGRDETSVSKACWSCNGQQLHKHQQKQDGSPHSVTTKAE